ncbi:hypothetical protein EIN_315030 [Entamoeba invadens IP1]|uniref:Uncharacterized protein n=1 Tax=Entamoeba invadens IP1 TaxID=370355 RepID=A0A0A1TZD4_ENTIV|nr:hypothetical protein EIN_315030 [Entamoeba invadens IP1]ELP86924.1 hypothetical protein EIN_315030 [Entamoeba invadens IP1]|eukprot:XP_004253695.1 hypothetical protein EIN_315030 [Entamoeba invadens IP1]
MDQPICRTNSHTFLETSQTCGKSEEAAINSKNANQPKFKERQNDAMNFQADLQSLLIALLTKHCKITIGRPHRLSRMTKQFIKIKELEFNRFDTINVLQYIQTLSKEKTQYEFMSGNTTKKTAKRRIQPTKRREVVRLLMDILLEFGYVVIAENETVDGYEGNVWIYSNGICIYDTEQIKMCGSIVNTYLASQLQVKTSVVLTTAEFVFVA